MLIPVQLLLFGFCVLVQCVIAAQWVALVPPCSFHTTDHVFSLFYVIFLVIFVSLLSIKSKRIKDNYREGSFIFILMMLKIPIWLAWIIGSIILPEAYHNACFGESSQPRNIVMHRNTTAGPQLWNMSVSSDAIAGTSAELIQSESWSNVHLTSNLDFKEIEHLFPEYQSSDLSTTTRTVTPSQFGPGSRVA